VKLVVAGAVLVQTYCNVALNPLIGKQNQRFPSGPLAEFGTTGGARRTVSGPLLAAPWSYTTYGGS
jgi:hypothetical protein